jgi:hypothetical protein
VGEGSMMGHADGRVLHNNAELLACIQWTFFFTNLMSMNSLSWHNIYRFQYTSTNNFIRV